MVQTLCVGVLFELKRAWLSPTCKPVLLCTNRARNKVHCQSSFLGQLCRFATNQGTHTHTHKGVQKSKRDLISVSIAAIKRYSAAIQERAREYIDDRDTVQGIIAEGCDAARDVARETMDDVRQAMGLVYK